MPTRFGEVVSVERPLGFPPAGRRLRRAFPSGRRRRLVCLLMGRSVKPAQAAHLSVVVLPFANLSGDPAQDYFADGITENLTTDLSRIRGSFVIARNTAFTYKGKSIDAKEIGKELGVRYVLEGSVQRDQNRVRVNAQLIDAESGAHMWADRFEADMADLFKLQDQVVAQLANALRYELGMAEATKAASTQNPDAIDLAMRGWALMPHSMPSKEQADAARPFFEQALKIDPTTARLWRGKPKRISSSISMRRGRTPTMTQRSSARPTERSCSTAAISTPIGSRANTSRFPVDPKMRCAPSTRGLRSIRTPRGCWRCEAAQRTICADFEEAKSDIQQAMLLSPRDPAMSQWYNLRADTELGLGHFDEALEDVKKAIDGGYRDIYSYINLAAAHALKGEMDEAKAAMAEARRLKPDLPSSGS